VEPQGYASQGYDDYEPYYEADEGYEDIVVTQEKLAQYFGDDDPAPAPRPAGSKPKSTRVPQPSVVEGDRLPVMGAQANPADPTDLYKAGLKEYRQEKFDAAIDLFTRFLDADPPSDYVDNALYWLGECHYGLGNYAEAAEHFHRIV